ASAGRREKLNRPLIHQFFGLELFSHAQFGKGAVELERRDGRVWVPNDEACVDRATASENQARRHALLRRERDSTPGASCPANGSQARRFQPLTHSSTVFQTNDCRGGAQLRQTQYTVSKIRPRILGPLF